MNMAPGRRAPRIAVAQPVIQKIRTLRGDQAAAVQAAMHTIGADPGEYVDLPTARPGTPYKALRTSLAEAPVIIYRQAQPVEQADWFVVSLMTPDEYRQQKADEQSGALRDPAIREEIRIAAGTAATTAAAAGASGETAPQTGGAATTTRRRTQVRSPARIRTERERLPPGGSTPGIGRDGGRLPPTPVRDPRQPREPLSRPRPDRG